GRATRTRRSPSPGRTMSIPPGKEWARTTPHRSWQRRWRRRPPNNANLRAGPSEGRTAACRRSPWKPGPPARPPPSTRRCEGRRSPPHRTHPPTPRTRSSCTRRAGNAWRGGLARSRRAAAGRPRGGGRSWSRTAAYVIGFAVYSTLWQFLRSCPTPLTTAGGRLSGMALPPDLARTLADEFVHQLPDLDPQETREWQESLDAVAAERGAGRARYLLAKLLERAH